MIYIELTGMNTATACGRTVKTSGKSSALPKLARMLIDDGYAAHDVTEVRRNGTVCFTPTPLSWWAKRDITEGDNACLTVKKHTAVDPAIWG